ncbi:MAG: hypothetical protein OEV15_10375 [Gallionella sp.]|nr:hypothetical protein [Gallionella sp.]
MELRKKSDDTKIIIALVCLFIGFIFVWNIAAHVSDIYELRLDPETCNQVKVHGLTPSANCVIAAPYSPAGVVPGGYLTLPGGIHIQIVPIEANRTNKSEEWPTSMKTQFWVALLFWAATLALLLSVFRDKQ